MFVRSFNKIKTNSALEAVYRVQHHLKWLKIKCRSSELQGLSCRNNIVTPCCSSAGRTSCVCFERSCSAEQARCPRLPGALNGQPCDTKQTYSALIKRCSNAPTCCWRSSGVYLYAFICVQYFKHTQPPFAITLRTNICVALMQRPPRTSNECGRTTDARKTLCQKMINFQCVGRASTMCDWALRSENNTKMTPLSAHMALIQRVPNACSANIQRIWGVLNAFWQIRVPRWWCAVYSLTLSPC